MVLFYATVFALLKGRGVLTPLDYPAAPGWAVSREDAFYAHALSFGAGGINGRMTLTLVQTGAT